MKIAFIADFFAEEVSGGGELNNEELINILSELGHNILKIKSTDVSDAAFQHFRNEGYTNFIIGNFMNLSEPAKQLIQEGSYGKYIIYEHDHKYTVNRNPGMYEDYIIPRDQIINYEFYKKAAAVICQSSFHKEIVEKNLNLDNIISVGGNLWPEKVLQYLEEISARPKTTRLSIMQSPIFHKNTTEAVRFCEVKKLNYELIPPLPYTDFLKRLGTNHGLVFFPKTPETLSRIVCEARMMGMKTITNKRLGATSEEWFKLKGPELIEVMRNKRKEIPATVLEIFGGN